MSKRNQLSAAYLLSLALSMFVLLGANTPATAQAKDLPDFAELVDKHGAAVVNVSTKARARAAQRQQLDNDDLNEFFRRFLPPDAVPRQSPQNPNTPRRNTPRGQQQDDGPLLNLGQGSGFIISNDGY
ncbi:MAG: serine peptidase, partial [Betaproteobacteria bacterium]|nr:serine peptidase [Betaproteobacteria bacterium]